jgi:hypothetical protein
MMFLGFLGGGLDGWRHRVLAAALGVCFVGAFLVASGCGASGAKSGLGPARWRVLSVSNPTNFRPGDQSGADSVVVMVTNVGGGSSDGSPVTIADALPAGLTAVEVFGVNAYHNPVGQMNKEPEFDGPPYGLGCSIVGGVPSCVTSEVIDAGDTLVMTVRVHVSTVVEGSGEAQEASVSGGGAPATSVANAVTVSSSSAAFGLASNGVVATSSSYQAGGHPNVTGEFFVNTVAAPSAPFGADNENCGSGPARCTTSDIEPVAPPKDVSFDLPAGLVGSVVGVPRCQLAEVVNSANCPRDTMVGVSTVIVRALHERFVVTVPIYNIAPNPGEPAAFALNGLFFPGRIDTSVVRDGAAGGYSVRATVSDITGGGAVYGGSVTLWGDPAEHSGPGPDNAARTTKGNRFLEPGSGVPPQLTFGGPGVEQVGSGPTFEDVVQRRLPLLTGPTQCSSPLVTSVETDSYENPGVFSSVSVPSGTATGCGALPFEPSFSVAPDTLVAGEPAGYSLGLAVPQDVEPEGLGSANIRRVVATLPAGTVISPSAAVGLGACSNEQFSLGSQTVAACPGDSKVGSVRVKTPDLEEELPGTVFLGAPECDPCSPQDAAEGRLVRLFVQVHGRGEDGILVKLEGTGRVNQVSGQLTATFNEDPQVPFSEFELVLTGGERAALSNPRACGLATTSLEVSPWSEPFTAAADLTSTFNVEGCTPGQFNPTFVAGTTSDQAGGFTPVSVVFGRSDGDGFLGGLQARLPVGLLGMISRVKLCGEAEANAGSCGAASLVGEASTEVGPGSDPYLVSGGRVFLTGPYRGAPYGLSVVVPASAGPYTLSGTTGTGLVVVRAAISVDPHTAAVTVTADPFPTELDGIPLQIRRVSVTVGGNDAFSFNPTNCTKSSINGVLTSVEGATADVSSPFQVGGCGDLVFKPKVSVSTGPRASKKDGASLLFKISYPAGAMGSEAWFREAKLVIPKQLPARLTTIQKACVQATFEANPADCPAGSRIGYAQVHTPVLPSVLKGPVFFVSYGNAKFPDVVVVLQGEGVTVDLTGETLIKNGVTSATFPDTPDVPFESLEVILPTGEFSEFGAYVSAKHPYQLCGSKLTVPTEFKAQNGKEIKESTPVTVNGCKIIKKKAKKAGKASRAAERASRERGGKS